MKVSDFLGDPALVSDAYDKHIYVSRFAIGDRVRIDAGKVIGTVIDISFRGGDAEECNYCEVSWFSSGEQRSCWFHAFRLSY